MGDNLEFACSWCPNTPTPLKKVSVLISDMIRNHGPNALFSINSGYNDASVVVTKPRSTVKDLEAYREAKPKSDKITSLPEAECKLRSLLLLPEDWDGYGSVIISLDCVLGALRVLRSVEEVKSEFTKAKALPPFYIVPVPGGRVQLEWYFGAKLLELEIIDLDHGEFLQWAPELGIENESRFYTDASNDILRLIRWVAS